MKFDSKALSTGMIDAPGHPEFGNIYELYNTAFPINEERGTIENFERNLARNNDSSIQKMAGPCKEYWVYVKDNSTGKVLAAANFCVFAESCDETARTEDLPNRIHGTLHSAYSFVDPHSSIPGLYLALMRSADAVAQAFVTKTTGVHSPCIITFGEQNSPLLMTFRQYEVDCRTSMEPNARRTMFERMGYRQLGFRYIQPAIEKNGDPCKILDLCVLGFKAGSIPSCIIKRHLDRWFVLSFPCGTFLVNDVLAPMQSSLESRPNIDLLPPGRFQELDRYLALVGMDHLPDDKRDMPLGVVYPDLAESFLGNLAKDYADVLPAWKSSLGESNSGNGTILRVSEQKIGPVIASNV